MKLTKEFSARLMALKTSGRTVQYKQACTVLVEVGTGTEVSKNFRSDSRIPDCMKYELPDGYRIVFQKVTSSNEHLALFVGSHDEVDHFLNCHKGWIFDPVRHTLRELRYNTATEDVNNVVRSPDLQPIRKPDSQSAIKVFDGLSAEQLGRSGMPLELIDKALQLTDPDAIETTLFLGELPDKASNLLLSYVTGSTSERTEIQSLLRGERTQSDVLGTEHLVALEVESDLFVDLADLPSEKIAFEELPFEDWMIYLHPDQRALVSKSFGGPARLRGVSGSGKTVVAVHRAREAARRNLQAQTDGKVLFVTFNKSLSELVSRLLMRLCTAAEFDKIEVATHGRWCHDYLRFRTGSPMSWNDSTRDRIWKNVIARYLPRLHQANFCLQVPTKEMISTRARDIQFVSDEIDFIYGKFLHSDVNSYMGVERVGRVRPLGPNQRALILSIYNDLVDSLTKEKHFDAREMPRLAYKMLRDGEAPEANYSDIIVDEVQDLTDMELKVLHAIEQLSGRLFLVGDGAQQIYRRGQSLRSVGINVAGRSFILKKNYRNTLEITACATALRVAQGIGRFDEDSVASQMPAIPSAVSGDRPCVLICGDPQQERQLVVREIKYLIKRLAFLPSHICCLAHFANTRKTLLSALKAAGINAKNYKAEEGLVDGDSVLVSSLHNSKGHEFRAVFILGLNEGSIPYLNSSEPEEVESEAALFYVAITRAKELLYLSAPMKTVTGKASRRSRFIADIEKTLDILDFSGGQKENTAVVVGI